MDVRKTLCLGAAGFLGALVTIAAAFPAHAEPRRPVIVQAVRPDPDAPTVKVSYFIADLRSDQGQKELVRRVHSATQEVCPYGFSDSQIDFYRNDCIKVAWRRAEPQIEAAIDAAKSSKVAGAVPMTVTIGIVGAQ